MSLLSQEFQYSDQILLNLKLSFSSTNFKILESKKYSVNYVENCKFYSKEVLVS